MNARLIMMLKRPRPGAVKTRLIPALGAEGACDLYRAMVGGTLAEARGFAGRRAVLIEARVTDGLPGGGDGDGWLGAGVQIREQGEGDLGERMERAARDAFAEGTEGVILIGADCPDLTREHLDLAWRLLEEAPVVLGPAGDGGYYLIAMRRLLPGLFRGIEWGGDSVLAQTVVAARGQGVECRFLEMLHDVDRPEDLALLKANELLRRFALGGEEDAAKSGADGVTFSGANRFEEILRAHRLALRRGRMATLQINVGRKCNQACRHCHVDAGPWRTEMMEEGTAVRIGEWIREHRPETVDITGGAPELSEFFKYFVELSRSAGCRVIDRNNLTIIEEDGYGHLPAYLAAHEVEVIASLPCYTAENVSRQRGAGVFDRSIAALKKLNAVGYGTRLPLHLVYNPVGAKLPGPQAELEADYKEALGRDFGIVFSSLYTITNQPIARFAEDLRREGKWNEYLHLLANSFNPVTIEGLMCRTTLSVGYRGEVYDCDFNQMLGMQLKNGRLLYLWDLTPADLEGRGIATGAHCLACAAGAGSSCTGALR